MNRIIENTNLFLKSEYNVSSLEDASKEQLFFSLSKAIVVYINENCYDTRVKYKHQKQAYYFSAEFLMGRALGNNLMNLKLTQEVSEALKTFNIDLNEIEEAEEDAGLGNGGLGRLAACFLDSGATKKLPLHGYGIRYQYGIFKQSFIDGFQNEVADNWLKHGDPWSIRREDQAVIVHFEDGDVKAVPYDTPVIGYNTPNYNTLRLWQAESVESFNYGLFNDQKYDEAVLDKNRAEDISRVLYPNDSQNEGKVLRLKQEYFFVSASIQEIVKNYCKNHGENFRKFSESVAIQLNDTHPVVAIPELIRILIDEHQIDFKTALKISRETFAYTNHTILQEALEKWWTGFYQQYIPRVYEIILRLNKAFIKELKTSKKSDFFIDDVKIVQNDMIHMANMGIMGSKAINGVAQLHTELLKTVELKAFYEIYPEKFNNKTNGITQRRWLKYANPELSSLIDERLGNENWITDLDFLKDLEKDADNEAVLKRFIEIKNLKKTQLADYIYKVEGVKLDPNTFFDIQVKRLHEYKRQLLSAFHILYLYYELKDNPNYNRLPRTFIFGAKSAPGYFRAKGIIKFINEIAKLVNNDPDTQGRISVHFVENYRVSYAEKIFPAADLSEQISTAGKEASGTGNMKFMLNGTPTIGTLDGANIEIVEEAGEENNYIFGAKVEELEALADNYDPVAIYLSNPKLKRVVDTLIDGTFDDGDSGMFKELYSSLLEGASWHKADDYFIFHDFDDYVKVQESVENDYKNPLVWAKKCWLNLANSGKFSSDRTIVNYAENIWNIKPFAV